jgi:uncharacterized membrane protein
METVSPVQRLSAVVPGLLLGAGLGALLDGVVLHGLLQWHHLLSATGAHSAVATQRTDAGFEAVAWVVTLVGILLTFRSWRHGGPSPGWTSEVGLLLAGWGLFDLVEGLVAHQLLGLHHVRDDLGGPLSWDLGFLAVGAVLALLGWRMHVAGRRQEHSVVQVVPALATFEAITRSEPVEQPSEG